MNEEQKKVDIYLRNYISNVTNHSTDDSIRLMKKIDNVYGTELSIMFEYVRENMDWYDFDETVIEYTNYKEHIITEDGRLLYTDHLDTIKAIMALTIPYEELSDMLKVVVML